MDLSGAYDPERSRLLQQCYGILKIIDDKAAAAESMSDSNDGEN